DKVKAGLQRVDGWVNLVTGMGTSGRSKAVNFQAGDRLSDEMLEALPHTGDPYANCICRVVPEEALRQGYRVKTGDSTEETAIGAHLDHWRVTSHLTAAWTWSRAFGGGVVFVGADDGRDPSEPLDEAAIRSVRFLVVADRRDLVPLTWCTDDESQRYGEPETYSFTRLSSGGASEVVIVHASRLIRFEGALTTRRRRTQLRGWGESELQRIYDVLSKFNGAWESTSTLLYQGSIGVLSMKNLFSMMAADKRDVLKTRLDMMDLAMSSTRNVLIDAEGESFTRTEVGALAGLAAVLDKFLLLLSGAAEIPVTILMGQSPAGLSATGESDVRWFYDRIKSAQTSTLTPCLLRLIRLLCLAKDGPTKGVVPAKLAVEFAPLWQMTPLELADLRQKQATTDGIYIDKQVVTADEVGEPKFGLEAEPGDHDRPRRARGRDGRGRRRRAAHRGAGRAGSGCRRRRGHRREGRRAGDPPRRRGGAAGRAGHGPRGRGGRHGQRGRDVLHRARGGARGRDGRDEGREREAQGIEPGTPGLHGAGDPEGEGGRGRARGVHQRGPHRRRRGR
ncbi:MAG: DUF1073 domain-containing protein, partial [Deltaproteobacteria bacterium]|nr:DUF1073 domain-containing protein [Deltaproteobacteria bacterium]